MSYLRRVDPAQFNPPGNHMGTAPKDRPILAYCKQEGRIATCPFCNYAVTDLKASLCLYHAHAEGLDAAVDGFHIIVWGGSWQDDWEDGGGSLPDWWFVKDSDYELAACPVLWWELPTQTQPQEQSNA